MNGENVQQPLGRLESITRKWWFFLLFILFQFFPAYAQKGYDPSKWGRARAPKPNRKRKKANR